MQCLEVVGKQMKGDLFNMADAYRIKEENGKKILYRVSLLGDEKIGELEENLDGSEETHNLFGENVKLGPKKWTSDDRDMEIRPSIGTAKKGTFKAPGLANSFWRFKPEEEELEESEENGKKKKKEPGLFHEFLEGFKEGFKEEFYKDEVSEKSSEKSSESLDKTDKTDADEWDGVFPKAGKWALIAGVIPVLLFLVEILINAVSGHWQDFKPQLRSEILDGFLLGLMLFVFVGMILALWYRYVSPPFPATTEEDKERGRISGKPKRRRKKSLLALAIICFVFDVVFSHAVPRLFPLGLIVSIVFFLAYLRSRTSGENKIEHGSYKYASRKYKKRK